VTVAVIRVIANQHVLDRRKFRQRRWGRRRNQRSFSTFFEKHLRSV